MENLETNQNLFSGDNSLHLGHLASVFFVALFLLSVTWFKQPELFNFSKHEATVSSANLPKYYAYETPAELNQPLVAGASTAGQGPMIIGEDGSLSDARDIGNVLGLSTEEYNLELDKIKVNKLVPATVENEKAYLLRTDELENEFINTQSFQTALTNLDQKLIDEEVVKVEKIISSLNTLAVPESLQLLHKYKLIQYQSAVVILQNFINADANPELVGSALGVFLKAQQDIESQLEIIQKQIFANE